MPKQRITKDMVIEAAFELAREGGLEAVLVKSIAAKLGTSVQPIYCYCNNMDILKEEVTKYTEKHLFEYIKKHVDTDNIFKSVGIAHGMFAKEEPQLYRLYFLRKRESISSFEKLYEMEANPLVAEEISRQHNISIEKAKEFHLNMMIYNIGLSFIISSLGEDTDIKKVEQLLDGAHKAFVGMLE